ncbi:MAG: NAD(P)/FAD-dependent oxidoreductase, partial [candidate division NC10 bacterium]|nr:NAD(P)/FAD-dependent oxidoreductase [candidate division NC10 bacterium]
AQSGLNPMDSIYDTVIIGAGIGGLTAGNFLARRGLSTLLLEQHLRPGGCASSFERGGFRFDAGVHWIAQCGQDGLIYQILQELGMEKEVSFARIVPPLSVAIEDRRYILPRGKAEVIAYLKDCFPRERRGIDSFFELQGEIAGEMLRLFAQDPEAKVGLDKLYFQATFPLRFPRIARFHRREGASVVDRLVGDGDLRKILKIAAIFPRVSMVLLSWFWEIIARGDCHYPQGGIQRIADALADHFRRQGGEIHLGKKVSRILCPGGRARAVELSDGTVIRARAILSNADARQTFLEMLSEGGDQGSFLGFRRTALPKRYREQIQRWRLSESFFYVYLGVDRDLGANPISAPPILWYFPQKQEEDPLPDYIGMSIPSLNDRSVAPAGMHTVIIGALADRTCERWFRDRSQIGEGEYAAWKAKMADSLTRLAEEAIPDLKGHIVVQEAASPWTFYRYTGNSMGASSGWSMDAKEQNRLSQRTPIRNLFLAGHWTFNPGGVPAAFLTGKRAAELVMEAI